MMVKLPPPSTFNEGQRLVYGWLAAGAGIFCGLAAVAMIAMLMWGGWSSKEEHTIVVIFGWALGGFITAMIVVIVGLLAGGPVGRVKISAGKEGISAEADNNATAIQAAASGAAAGAVAAATSVEKGPLP